jgi:outer membrane immunogenic protein
MKKFLLGGVALVAMFVGPAMAADMRVKAPVLKAPPPPAVYNWAGCYVGGNAGWIGGRDRVRLAPAGTYLTPAGAAAPPNAGGTGLLAGDQAIVTLALASNDSGFEGGGQIGCNWQNGMFVFGGEADFNYSGLRHTAIGAFAATASVSPGFTISPETDRVTTKLNWFSTVRGRAGVAVDRWFFYGTGGAVIADLSSTTNVAFTTAGALPVLANAVHVGNATTTRIRPVVGAGLEYAFGNNWSAKAEALFFDLGTLNYASPLTAPAGVAAGYAWNTSVRLRETDVRVGLNYKFGSSLGAAF